MAAATEMIHLAEEIDDPELALHGYFWRLEDLVEAGDIEAADEDLEAHARLAEEVRHPTHRWYAAVRRAMRAILVGDHEMGERLAGEAFQMGQRVNSEDAFHALAVQLFWLRWDQGRLDEVEETAREYGARYPAIPGWRGALAILYSELGKEAEASAELERLAADDFARIPYDANWIPTLTFAAEACAFVGDRARAERLYELLRPYGSRICVTGYAPTCSGSVARPLGLLTGTLGRQDDAARHFEEAIAANEKIGAAPWAARAQHEYAGLLLAQDRDRDRLAVHVEVPAQRRAGVRATETVGPE